MKIESHETVALPDYGDDYSAMDERTWAEIKSRNIDLESKKLDSPVSIELAIDTSKTGKAWEATKEAKLSISIELPGSKLPVFLHDVSFLIFNARMNEVLLGRPFLLALGFDFEDHLRRVKHLVDGKSIIDIERTSKLRKMAYNGLVYGYTDDDPVEPPEHLIAGFGEDTPESISEQFDRMVNESIKNGMTNEGSGTLRVLLEKHRDCFRIKLGSDPPATVRPLLIHPKPDAKPFRSPQRRYGPEQSAFIINTVCQLEKLAP